MTEQNTNKEFYFNDCSEADAYCPGDPKPEEIDWENVVRFQKLIDNLPKEKEARKTASYVLRDNLDGDI